jgi:hypothetical protein
MASPTNAIRDSNQPKAAAVDMKLEVIVIPVSDVDRAEKTATVGCCRRSRPDCPDALTLA